MAMNAISSLMLDSSSPVLTLKSQPCLYLIKKTEITWKEYPQAPTAHLSTFQHLYCPGSILSCHCEWLCSCLGQPSTCPFDPSPPHLFKDNAPAIFPLSLAASIFLTVLNLFHQHTNILLFFLFLKKSLNHAFSSSCPPFLSFPREKFLKNFVYAYCHEDNSFHSVLKSFKFRFYSHRSPYCS